MMADGYGFCALLIIIILHHQMIFIYQRPKLDYSDLKPEILKWCLPKKEKNFPVSESFKINGHDPQVVRDRVSFEHLTPVFHQKI
jgi:transcription termination factor Rho